MAALTAENIRKFIEDSPDSNLLKDNMAEFTDSRIELAMDLAISSFNVMPPKTGFTLDNFPEKSVLLYGTLTKLFEGQAALAARNHLSYSDGGVTIPIEERYPMYSQLADTWRNLFLQEANRYKVQLNIESGWGEVSSDYAYTPIW